MAVRKQPPQAICKNCGEPTNFGNATADRIAKGWCTPCFKVWLRDAVKGDAFSAGEYYYFPRELYARKPGDSRPVYDA